MAFRDVIHFDQGDVLRHERTPEGFLNCYMRVAKIGDLQYRNADGTTRTEYVSKDSLFNADSVKSLKMKPVTFEHPPALLTAETARGYSTGSTGHLTVPDGSFLGITAVIHDKHTIDAILSGKAREVSCGYTCDLVKRADGSFEQRNRQYNHVAITRKGRAGNSVAVHMDSVNDANIWTQIRGDSMSDELFQIDIAGSVTRVDADTYQLIQQERRDAEKKMSAMAAKMAKLRAMQGDEPEDEEDDEEEDMPMVKTKAKKDASCSTRKDAKAKAKAMPDPEEDDEDMEDEDEYDHKDAFDHVDSADSALLETLIENRLLKARLDAESDETSEDEEEDPEEDEPDEDEDDEDYGAKKRKDAADILNTWIAVADELAPALVRGDAIVEGIEIEDGNLHFDSVDATDLKEAYIKLHKLDDLLSETGRYDSLAIATVFNIAKKSQSRLDSNAPKSRSRKTLDSALKGSRHDTSDIRYSSIQEDIEAGRRRLNC